MNFPLPPFLHSLILLQRHELRERYPTGYALGGEVFGLIASLAIYGFTSRAISQSATGNMSVFGGAQNYFEYLVIGETTLFIPLALFQGLSRSFRQCLSQGTWQAMLSQPITPNEGVYLLAAARIPLELARVFLTLLFAFLIFNLPLQIHSLHTPWIAILAAILLQIVAAPTFLGFGLIGVACIWRFGRGDSFLNYLGGVASILAGAYFPLSVLPTSVNQLTQWSSPFTVLLETTRQVMSGDFETLLPRLAILALWSLGSLVIGTKILQQSLNRPSRPGMLI